MKKIYIIIFAVFMMGTLLALELTNIKIEKIGDSYKVYTLSREGSVKDIPNQISSINSRLAELNTQESYYENIFLNECEANCRADSLRCMKETKGKGKEGLDDTGLCILYTKTCAPISDCSSDKEFKLSVINGEIMKLNDEKALLNEVK
jgi:hypothetical protein